MHRWLRCVFGLAFIRQFHSSDCSVSFRLFWVNHEYNHQNGEPESSDVVPMGRFAEIHARSLPLSFESSDLVPNFGLVSIPVRLYRAARAEKVSFRQLHRTGPAEEPESDTPTAEPIPIRPDQRTGSPASMEVSVKWLTSSQHRLFVAPVRSTPTSAENQPIPRSEIVKGYEYQPTQYVLLSDEELRRITPRTSSEIQILEFVHLREIDPVYFENLLLRRARPRGRETVRLAVRGIAKDGLCGSRTDCDAQARTRCCCSGGRSRNPDAHDVLCE
jgi:hypothetical protein